jgi:hypothetical protein
MGTKTCKRKFVKYKTKENTIVGLQGTKPRWIYRKKINYDKFESFVPDEFKKMHTKCVPNGLIFDDWIAQSSILTIKDICKMKKGDSIDIAVIDRNVLDTDRLKPFIQYSPTHFFKHAKGKYVHSHGLQGKLILGDSSIDPFEFHVRLPNLWYPLKNGILPAKDDQTIFELYDKPIKWQDMPTTIPIGFRGPMIVWSKLGNKSLYYSE